MLSSGGIVPSATKNRSKSAISEVQDAAPKSSLSSVRIATMKTLSASMAEVAGFER